jgi:adenosylcobinamide-phosphate synthase
MVAGACARVIGGSAQRAWRVWLRDGSAHPSPNAGQVEAAFAGALDVRLGGVNAYGGRIEERGTLGDGPEPGASDLRRAVTLSRAVGLATLVIAAAGAAR